MSAETDISNISHVPAELLEQILDLLPLQTLVTVRTTSKFWNQVVSKLEMTTKFWQEKFFSKYSEFIQVAPADASRLDWSAIFSARSRLPNYQSFGSIPWEIDLSSFEENEIGSNFPTFFGNIGVWSGCYYYEVTLHDVGLMQIGWTTLDDFPEGTEGAGIGDTNNSWAYDGAREKLWNLKFVGMSRNFPHKWKNGDIVGCGINATSGQLDFWLNGTHLGTAWQSVWNEDVHPPFFPALSAPKLSDEPSKFCFNMLGPFSHLPSNYNPISETIPNHIPIKILSIGPISEEREEFKNLYEKMNQKMKDIFDAYKTIEFLQTMLERTGMGDENIKTEDIEAVIEEGWKEYEDERGRIRI